MVDPMRRVCSVTPVAGQGSGQRLSVLPLALSVSTEDVVALAPVLSDVPGFVRAYLLMPDAVLSSPLPNESTVDRRLIPLLVIETGHAGADGMAMAAAMRALPCDTAQAKQAAHYALRWKLFSHELTK